MGARIRSSVEFSARPGKTTKSKQLRAPRTAMQSICTSHSASFSSRKTPMKLKPVSPVVKLPVIDRLTFVLPWEVHSYKDQSSVLAPVHAKIEAAITAGRCIRTYPRGSRYKENFRIQLNSGATAHVFIGAIRPDHQNGGIRISCNPSKFAAGDAKQLNRVMRKIIGPDYDELMKRPLINCLDIAVDVYYLCLDNVLFLYTNAQRHTMFCKRFNGHGHIEGYNMGSEKSAYMAAVYSKNIERVHAAVLEIAKNGAEEQLLKSNAVRQLKRLKDGPEIVRIESRGKKMRGTPLHKIASQPNRFERFSFVDLAAAGPELEQFTKLAFHALCRQDGAKAALAAFKHHKDARAVHAYWRKRQASWWQPEPMWQQACKALRDIGLFPDEAFDMQ